MRIEITTAIEVDMITVPATTLPNGLFVPEFKVGKYITGRENGALSITVSAMPWTEINYRDCQTEAQRFGLKLITETQYLAIAFNISQQDINWTGGKVGHGSIYQGMYKGSVDGAKHGIYESKDPDERRWHELSNGERIFDISGNCFSWTFDDVQGDSAGIVKSKFAKDSLSIICAPAKSREQGVGWIPDAGSNWSGYALVRGGCWYSDGNAGVFYLYGDHPGYENGNIGFRSTIQ